MQSLLGSLNYYSQFIEEFAIYASVLYELREAAFHEIHRLDNTGLPTLNKKAVEDRMGQGDIDPDRTVVTGGDPTVDN